MTDAELRKLAEPTNAEIQARHDAILFIDWAKDFDPEWQPNSLSNVEQCHNDRGILLKRLEAAESENKGYGHALDSAKDLIAELEAPIKAMEDKIRYIIDSLLENGFIRLTENEMNSIWVKHSN